jgi:uncharacterized protein
MRDSMIKIIRQNEYKEGRWRNGMGISWEIASDKEEGAADFSWRFAKAQIDNDVPFSIYPGMDRVFMMLEGGGIDLEFEGGNVLEVHEKWVPHQFSCDVPLFCRLRGGPSLDLNLFVDRKKFGVEAEVTALSSTLQQDSDAHRTIIYVLAGECQINHNSIRTGESAVCEGHCEIAPSEKKPIIFVANIFQK